MQTLEAELRELVRLFNEEKVSYALCVEWRWHPWLSRFTQDIDFLIPPESLDQARGVAARLDSSMSRGRIPFARLGCVPRCKNRGR